MSAASIIRGRLAPSPTGFIHLGNAWAFLLAWLAARSVAGQVVLRIEDIDPQRSKPHYTAALIEDLKWLGLDWDFGPDRPASAGLQLGSFEQSQRTACYTAAIARLERAGLVYPCFCTRKELRSLAGAPHVDDAGAPYPGTCRDLSPAQQAAMLAAGRRPCLRLRCPAEPITFTDAILGDQSHTLVDCGGDFALRRSDGVVAYQLAVAVDDGLMGINQVVRGRDILSSTPRQIALMRLLGYGAPTYAHVPLLLDAEDQRLAKRHQSLSLRELRQAGASPRRIVGFLGELAGCNPGGGPAHPAELAPRFSLANLRRDDIRLEPETTRLFAA
jgi:glutamyl-queuosine tRNA(Asp) synthetase